MRIRLVYFSWVRERIGRGEEEIALAGPASVGELLPLLAGRSAGHAAAFADAGRIRAAVNQQHAGLDHMLADGDEVALFPPVTGGRRV